MNDKPKEPVTLESAQEVTVAPPKPDRNAQLGWIGKFWAEKSKSPLAIARLKVYIICIGGREWPTATGTET